MAERKKQFGHGAPLDLRLRTGRQAESLAAHLLESIGYTIVVRNWRRPQAELDMVVLDGATCVFVEVRSRTGTDTGHPLDSIDGRKRTQVIRAARLFLAEEQLVADGYRFDVVAIVFKAGDTLEPIETIHIPDAFRVGDSD